MPLTLGLDERRSYRYAGTTDELLVPVLGTRHHGYGTALHSTRTHLPEYLCCPLYEVDKHLLPSVDGGRSTLLGSVQRQYIEHSRPVQRRVYLI